MRLSPENKKFINRSVIVLLIISSIFTLRAAFVTALALVDSDNRELGGIVFYVLFFLFGLLSIIGPVLIQYQQKRSADFVSKYFHLIFWFSTLYTILLLIVFLITFFRYYMLDNIQSESLSILIENAEPWLSIQVISLTGLTGFTLHNTFDSFQRPGLNVEKINKNP